ncbi:MAG: S1/P1 Nuclease [Gammaproteobacteria bacterium]|nr:S1/P1 Nuclease [Gammaproteobacteria bacterium]
MQTPMTHALRVDQRPSRRSMSRACALVLAALPSFAIAWGASGHRLVSETAARELPKDLPDFLTGAATVTWLGELGREADRMKGAGRSPDRNANPGHYVNADDAGLVLGAVPLHALPPDREEYDTALRAKGVNQYKAGYLPYSIVDGWFALRKDFAYWRADTAGLAQAKSAREKRWYKEDRRHRETLTLRDLGYWSHFVADGSQPMHVSIHFNGWGEYPNPTGYTTAKTLHAEFEGAYVSAHVTDGSVIAALPPPKPLDCDIEKNTADYLAVTLAEITPLYRLEKQGAFKTGDGPGKAFVVARLAAGAAMIRDLVTAAWTCSAEASVGFPPITVKDIEAGTADPWTALRGED